MTDLLHNKPCGWRAMLGACMLACATPTLAQEIRLVGTIGGSRAIVLVDGGQPRTLSIGQSHGGITLVEVQGSMATFDSPAGRQVLRVGQAPARVNAGTASILTLVASSGGHYFADGQIDGHAVRFMVDTGATNIALDATTASRMNIDYRRGQEVTITTANGRARGWAVQLDEVRVGSLSQRNVSATVSEQTLPYALLGNSFLNHYHMTRDASSMVLKVR